MLTSRTLTQAVALAVLCIPAATGIAQNGRLISDSDAARFGLTQAWFTQVELDRSQHRIEAVSLDEGTLFVTTDGAVVQSIDVETGRTNWVQTIGSPRRPSMAVGANEDYVAAVNGLQLYLMERKTGRPLWDRKLGGVPGAGPALTTDYVFVPMVDGRVEGYRIGDGKDLKKDSKHPVWAFQSAGRALTQPFATPDAVAWPTDRGHLYVCRPNNPSLRFRFEAFDALVGQPAYARPWLIVAGLDGYVSSVHERTGDVNWDFSAGDPVEDSPVVIGDNVYVVPKTEGLFCISARSGQQRWYAPRIKKFLAGSDRRVYATDRLGRLVILDAKTGGQIDSLDTRGLDLLIVNRQSDRILLGTSTGLIQCLHEIGRGEPMQHYTSYKSAEEPAEAAAPMKPAGPAPMPEKMPPTQENPFGDGQENPFGGGQENPFGGGGADAPKQDPEPAGQDNPFAPPPDGAPADNPFG